MKTRYLISLAVLMSFSLAVLPSAAAAAPHYYAGSALAPEAVQTPYIAWGTLTLTNSAGTVECRNTVTGYDENPTGGGAGEEVTQSFSAYNCTNESCELGGGRMRVSFENESEPGPVVQLNWPGELTETVKGTIRLKSTNVRVLARCQFAHVAPVEEAVKEGPLEGLTQRTSVEFFPDEETCTTQPGRGSMEPKETNGTSTAKPSKTEFGKGGSEGLECGDVPKGTVGGKLKAMGYNESELITTKNP